ncbi:MAG: hypothetical protein AVDCRST_MAG49-600 [uncultured Thermomicrobiales bacterium]|uniref:RNA polymerase sigma-70 region 2 domain-containing protein n=1 Tax=uncultured Thermomicrobiales bacterium TaxID=1645740 RepID=A0A6J4U2M8_9BACT|nr:MAG: hypothetical protein AVDCRST_MAG49-600 [uncultured Thermomicrobiales bacterium]
MGDRNDTTPPLADRATLLAVTVTAVLDDARRQFAGTVDRSWLERYVWEIVLGLWDRGPRVTAYLPELALRQVRRRVGQVEGWRLAPVGCPPAPRRCPPTDRGPMADPWGGERPG